MLNRRRMMMRAQQSSETELPSDYTRVVYLESTGTQYIDTGFTPDVNSAMYIRLSVTDDGIKNNWCGVVLGGSAGWFNVGGSKKSEEGLVANFSSVSAQGCNIPYDNNYHDYYISNGLQKIDQNEAYNEITRFIGKMLTVWLFIGHKNYNGTLVGKQRIQLCRLYDNGVLAHDFVPCVRVTDSKPGMYDTVTQQFFVNAGSGEFVWG